MPENIETKPDGQYDANSIWWQHELLHREILKDFDNRSRMIQPGRDDFEHRWIETALQKLKSSKQEKMKISDQAFHEAAALTQDWTEQVKMQKISQGKMPLITIMSGVNITTRLESRYKIKIKASI